MHESRLPPTLFHFTAPDAYMPIFEHGLRSASQLLEDFAVPEEERRRLTSQPRSQFVELGPHPRWGTARLAHNTPLLTGSQKTLAACLEKGGSTLSEFCDELSQRVFFWAYERDADGYRGQIAREGTYDRITFRTAAVLRLAREQGRTVEVSRFNTGSVPRTAEVRGKAAWTSIADAPRAKEVVVLGGVAAVEAAAISVVRFHGDDRWRVWPGGAGR